MKVKRKKTLGQMTLEQQGALVDQYELEDIREKNRIQYLQNLEYCAHHAIKQIPCRPECEQACKDIEPYKKDFFIQVVNIDNPLLPTTFKKKFIAKSTCPMPWYGEDVYRFNYNTQQIEFLFSLPTKNFSDHLRKHYKAYPKEYDQLISFVAGYDDGTLEKRVKEYNGEDKNTVYVITENPNIKIIH